MSNQDAEKEEMKDETHDVEDAEQDEQDAENENDADYQQEQISYNQHHSKIHKKLTQLNCNPLTKIY